MKATEREVVLLIATVTVALFGVTSFLARPKLAEWKQIRDDQQIARASIERAERMLGSKERWEGDFAELSQQLPHHPEDRRMDIHWLSFMDKLASSHEVKILRRQAGEEKRLGDVYEMPIECREWEGSLDAMVHFLYALHEEGAMLDVRQLYVKPKNEKVLRGRFTLYCAYTKGAVQETE